MRYDLNRLFSGFAVLAIASVLPAAEEGPIDTVVTQYIAPVDNPTWEAAVYKGTEAGITYDRKDDGSYYYNYAIQISGDFYYGLSSWVKFNGFLPVVLPPEWTRSCLTTGSPARRYLYAFTAETWKSTEYTNYGGTFNSSNVETFVLEKGLDSTSSVASGPSAVYVQCVHTDYVYQVTYDPNGASGLEHVQIYTNASTLAANGFARTGYTFTGWNTQADGKGVSYDDEAAVSGRGLLLYAQWMPEKRTVEAVAGSAFGTVSPSGEREYDYESVCRLTATPYDGYHFTVWMVGEKEVSTDNPYSFTVTENVIVKGSFAPNTYTVTFNANGGTGSVPDDIHAEYDTAVTLPRPSFSKDGYTFSGWALNEDGAGRIYDVGVNERLNLTQVNGATVILYAVWKSVRYTLVLHRNDGTGATEETDAVLGGVPASVTPPRRDGYRFGGYWDAGFSARYIDENGVGVTEWTEMNGGDLYAKWTPNTYLVRFDAGASDATGGMADQPFTYDVAQALTPNAFERKGWLFTGWSDTASGSVAYTDGQTVSNLTIVADGVKQLFAVWERNVKDVTFMATDGLIVENGGKELVVENTYVPGEPYGTLPAATNAVENVVFAGWWTSTDLTNAVQVSTNDLVSGEIDTLYARWKSAAERPTADVTFHRSATASETVSVEIGSEIGPAMPSDPEHTDPAYAFFGWFDEADNRVTSTTVVTNGMTVTARWTLSAFNDLFDCRAVAFSTNAVGGVPGWSVDPDGERARSGAFDPASDDRQVSFLKAWTDVPGRLSFGWEVSCSSAENVYSTLSFLGYMCYEATDGEDAYFDDWNVSEKIFGSVEEDRACTLSAGGYIAWRYERHEFAASGTEDAGWIENLVFTPDPVTSAIDGWTSIPAVTNDTPSAVFETGGSIGWRLTDDPAVVVATNVSDGCSDWIALSVDGPGTLTFDWRVSCEPGYTDTNGVYTLCDHLGLYLDDATEPVVFIDGFPDSLTTCVYTNTASGRRVYRWRYVKDSSGGAGADAAWLANVTWTPLAPAESDGETFTYTDATGVEREVTVPKAWVDDNDLLPAGSDDYRAALEALSGKTGFAGTALTYWQEYLAGTDPTDPDDVFRITAIDVTDGTVTLTWSPDLRAATPPRAYQVLGKARLDDPDETWAPTNAASRFFRVDVHMK